MGLAEKTSAETLKNAFERALSARVILDKETGVSKRWEVLSYCLKTFNLFRDSVSMLYTDFFFFLSQVWFCGL